MATNVDKVFDLVKRGADLKLPEQPQGSCVIRDEDGKDRIRFGFTTHREIIREVGYEADPEVSADVAAAVAAMTELVKDKKVMEAWLITPQAIAEKLSDDGNVDPENEPAVQIALALLKESLRTYSSYYSANK